MVAEVTQAMVCTMLNGAHCTNDTYPRIRKSCVHLPWKQTQNGIQKSNIYL